MSVALRAVRRPLAARLAGRATPLASTGAVARALSLDVAAAAVAGGAMAAHLCRASLPWTWWPILAASVWSAYTLDHLLDARQGEASCRAPRHRFHRRHGRTLAAVWVVVVFGSASLAWTTLPSDVLFAGWIVAAGVALHVALARREVRGLPKEVRAATLYTAGVWLAPLVAGAPTVSSWVLVALHAAAAYANLAANAWFEVAQDRTAGVPSVARALGRPRLRRRLRALALFAGSLALCGAVAHLRSGAIAVAVAFAVLAALQVVPASLVERARDLRRNEAYRAPGDAAFLLCLVVLLWAPP